MLQEYSYGETSFLTTIIKKLSEDQKNELAKNNYTLFTLEYVPDDPDHYMIFTENHPLFNIMVMRKANRELVNKAYHISIDNIRKYNDDMRKVIKELYQRAMLNRNKQ